MARELRVDAFIDVLLLTWLLVLLACVLENSVAILVDMDFSCLFFFLLFFLPAYYVYSHGFYLSSEMACGAAGDASS